MRSRLDRGRCLSSPTPCLEVCHGSIGARGILQQHHLPKANRLSVPFGVPFLADVESWPLSGDHLFPDPLGTKPQHASVTLNLGTSSSWPPTGESVLRRFFFSSAEPAPGLPYAGPAWRQADRVTTGVGIGEAVKENHLFLFLIFFVLVFETYHQFLF